MNNLKILITVALAAFSGRSLGMDTRDQAALSELRASYDKVRLDTQATLRLCDNENLVSGILFNAFLKASTAPVAGFKGYRTCLVCSLEPGPSGKMTRADAMKHASSSDHQYERAHFYATCLPQYILLNRDKFFAMAYE